MPIVVLSQHQLHLYCHTIQAQFTLITSVLYMQFVQIFVPNYSHDRIFILMQIILGVLKVKVAVLFCLLGANVFGCYITVY